jgi:hypothetical protein
LLRRCADTDDFASRKCLAQFPRSFVAGVLTKQDLHFVEKEDDATFRSADLGFELRNTLGQRSTNRRSRDQRGGFDADEDFVLETCHVATCRNARCQASNYACFPDALRTNEAGIVGLPFRKNVKRALNFDIAANNRVQLTERRLLREILAKLYEQREQLRVECKTIGGLNFSSRALRSRRRLRGYRTHGRRRDFYRRSDRGIRSRNRRFRRLCRRRRRRNRLRFRHRHR